MTWFTRRDTVRATLLQIVAFVLAATVLHVGGCSSSPKSKTRPQSTPVAVPPPPESANIVSGHQKRETIQFQAAERINVVVTGTAVETEVKEQTGAIVQANRDASAGQIAEMAQAFAATVAAQAAEIKRIGADNKHLAEENEKLTAANTSLQQQLDDFGRKLVVYTANGLGALCMLLAVGVGIATKNLGYVAWCVGGSLGGFGTARLVGHWLFPWVLGVGIAVFVAGFVTVLVIERRKRARDARVLRAGDDVISGVEDVRALFKHPPAELVEAIRTADTTEKAVAAVRLFGSAVSSKLRDWVSEADGTAAVVDERRRELGLI